QSKHTRTTYISTLPLHDALPIWTAATIRRAGQLANGDVVLVKVCKPTQDTRFDLPAVGPATIAALAQVQGRTLAFEAGRTIVLRSEEHTSELQSRSEPVCRLLLE